MPSVVVFTPLTNVLIVSFMKGFLGHMVYLIIHVLQNKSY